MKIAESDQIVKRLNTQSLPCYGEPQQRDAGIGSDHNGRMRVD